MAAKKSGRARGSAGEYVREAMAADPAFAAVVRAEFDKLELARELRRMREKAGLNQTELAARAGTTQSAIARLESGRVVPKLDLLSRVAAALGRRVRVKFAPEARTA